MVTSKMRLCTQNNKLGHVGAGDILVAAFNEAYR